MPSDEFEAALRILGNYYTTMMEQVAQDIIRSENEFQKGNFGNAENIIENQCRRVQQLSCLYWNIRAFKRKKPKGDTPLKANEFRCFGCGGVIREQDDICSICGWTWK